MVDDTGEIQHSHTPDPREMIPEVRAVVLTRHEQDNVAYLEARTRHEQAQQSRVDTLTAIVGNSQKTSDPLTMSPVVQGQAEVFLTEGDALMSPFSLTQLGLPPLPEQLSPLAVLVSTSKNGPTCIEAFGMRNRSEKDFHPTLDRVFEKFTLQDPGSALGKEASPVWLRPGEVLFPGLSPEVELTVTDGYKVEGSQHSHIKAKIGPASYATADDEVRGILVRAQPLKIEKTLVSTAEHDKRHKGRRLSKKVGAFAFAALSLLPIIDRSEQEAITSADDMIELDAKNLDNRNRRQAEAGLDQETLQTMHTAFESFFAGDKQALRDMAENAGYKTGWLDVDQLNDMSSIESPEDLTSFFSQLMGDVPISLNVPLRDLDNIMTNSSYKKPDLSSARSAAKEVLQSLNKLDKKMLSDGGPLIVTLAENVKADDHGAKREVGGYYVSARNGNPAEIVIDIRGGVPETLDHEYGHHLDSLYNLRSKVASFNPTKHEYVGYDKYENSKLSVDGEKVVKREYGNANEGEDTAVNFEGLTQPNKLLYFYASVLNEKQVSLLGSLEKRFPGITASLLSEIDVPDKPSFGVDDVLKGIANSKVVLTPALLLLLAGSASLAANTQNIDKKRRTYAL